jgi:hypothetical protein
MRAKDLNQNSSTAMGTAAGTGLGHVASVPGLRIDTDTPSNALLHNQSIEQIGSPNSPGKKSKKSPVKNTIKEVDGEEEPKTGNKFGSDDEDEDEE